MNEISVWNGHTVYGDSTEIVFILGTQGWINIDKNDIVSVLSAEGDNWIVSATDTSLGEAFKRAVAALPYPLDEAERAIFCFQYGSNKPVMSNLNIVAEIVLSSAPGLDLIWGIYQNNSLEDLFKVVIIASVNPRTDF